MTTSAAPQQQPSATSATQDFIPLLDSLGPVRWSPLIVGEDQSQKFTQIIDSLRRPPSPDGTSKRLASGSSYWGVESTMAWMQACNDPYYPVMREGIDSFRSRYATLARALSDTPYHYFSLGPGTGEKDNAVLRHLARIRPAYAVRYVPVDISSEMLRQGLKAALKDMRIPVRDTLPLQLDFSTVTNLTGLRQVADQLAADTPVLYSLLGNTLANFDNDATLLTNMASILLRPQDRFLLEVAVADRIDQAAADTAAAEYRNSVGFYNFVTSAIMHYTDLQIVPESVEFHGEVEDGKALNLRIVYRNETGQTLRPLLPNRTTFDFPHNDTICLLTTRKYLPSSLDKLIADAGLRILQSREVLHPGEDVTGERLETGQKLLLLARSPNGARSPGQSQVTGLNPFRRD